jgi:exodeoxyribonuclease VII large subunit
VESASDIIRGQSLRILAEQRTRFRSEVKFFRSVTANMLERSRYDMKTINRSLLQQSVFLFRNQKTLLTQYSKRIPAGLRILIRSRNIEITHLGNQIKNMSPESVLKRGYSITRLNGKTIKKYDEIIPGITIETTIFEGNISSIVQSTRKPATDE